MTDYYFLTLNFSDLDELVCDLLNLVQSNTLLSDKNFQR